MEISLFDWERLLINDSSWEFLWEVAFRSAFMFLVVVAAIRLTGKRGIRQLSMFEIVIIIGLGSAAGDPMIYEDVGLLPALVVFVTVILLYRLITWLVGQSKTFARIMEGRPVCLIENGQFSIDNFRKEPLAQDEFFMELRLQHIEHLGQVRQALIEVDGEISVFFYPDEEVRPGLPILPSLFAQGDRIIPQPGIYSCTHCGHTLKTAEKSLACPRCHHHKWVASIHTTRVT